MFVIDDEYEPLVIQSKVLPIWSVKSYTNGYFYFLTADKKLTAYPRVEVPTEVLDELDLQASRRIK